MLNPNPVPIQPEDIFVERYDRLLAWSLQITERDHELAEDLLHDLFIQFTVNEPDLQRISNLDGYLYAMLRNLHLAQRRRDTRNTLQQLSIVEYDSAEVGLRTVDLRDQIQAQDDLRRVCNYACSRKATAKIASVLILRFFYGYYPEEIVKILRSPRPSIDNWLKLARNEARVELNVAGRLEFLHRSASTEILPTGYARNLDVFLEELRLTIFETRRGACFSDEDLKQLYQAETMAPVECSQLAHIVSCAYCLDRVSTLFGLPVLADRSATETLGRDTRKRGGGGSGGTGGGLSKLKLSKLRRRVKDTLSHKPQELCVSVNGYTLGSQRVSSERSELNLVVDREERISFVEVFTEQKIRLLMMGIEELPPDGPGQRTTYVKMSDERRLELTLRFVSPSPTIQVVYSDPHFNESVDLAATHKQRETETRRHGDAENAQVAETPRVEDVLDGSNSPDLIFSESPRPRVSASSDRPVYASPSWRFLLNWAFWLRPQTVTAVFALLLLAGFAYLGLRTDLTKPTAPELLSQSIAAEETLSARTDLVLHRTLTLEERELNGRPVSRNRVEIWHSAARGVTARRLYDDSGRLLAGDWARPGSPNAIYRSHHAVSQPKVELRDSESAIRTLELWQLAPSAKDFKKLIGNAEAASLAELNNAYVVTYEQRTADTGKPGVVKATLTLSRADLHANELTLLVRSGSTPTPDTRSPPPIVEYRFTESAFERRSPDSVAPSVFDPEVELLVPATELETRNSKLETASPAPALSSVVATAELEAEVLRLLNQAGADMDDQTSVARTSEGKLSITGVVETEERKAEILRALGPLKGNPALSVRIDTVAEFFKRQKQSPSTGSTTVERVEVAKAQFAVQEDVRRYLGKQEGQADDEVRQFAARILNRSRLVMSEAGTLRRLAGQFSPEDLRNMSPEARAKWLSVIRAHARNCEQEAKRLRLELQPIFFPGGSPGAASDSFVIIDDASLARAAARLFELASANDRVVRSAFTISSEPTVTTVIRASQFWESLKSAESLAGLLSKQ